MDNRFMLIPLEILNRQAVTDIVNCNDVTSHYGLSLTHSEATALAQTRTNALEANGRIEFGGGVIDKLILEFCSSPYVSQFNYADTLDELVQTFYYFKNESLDLVSDDVLIAAMRRFFDESCQGSLELLQGRELEMWAHNIRFGAETESTLWDEYSNQEEGNDD